MLALTPRFYPSFLKLPLTILPAGPKLTTAERCSYSSFLILVIFKENIWASFFFLKERQERAKTVMSMGKKMINVAGSLRVLSKTALGERPHPSVKWLLEAFLHSSTAPKCSLDICGPRRSGQENDPMNYIVNFRKTKKKKRKKPLLFYHQV